MSHYVPGSTFKPSKKSPLPHSHTHQQKKHDYDRQTHPPMSATTRILSLLLLLLSHTTILTISVDPTILQAHELEDDLANDLQRSANEKKKLFGRGGLPGNDAQRNVEI